MRVSVMAIVQRAHGKRLFSFARLSYSQHMLPIFRLLPVGGVLLAIVILVLALTPPGGTRSSMRPGPARGALIERGAHPEWRQFLMTAATRRADELNRLRELPDSPARGTRMANLPADGNGTDANETTGALPGGIGEPSSAELPANKPGEQPAGMRPANLNQQSESRRPRPRRFRQAAAGGQPFGQQPFAQPFFFGQPGTNVYVSPDAYQARAGTFNPD